MIDIRNYFAPSVLYPGLQITVQAGIVLVNGSGVLLPTQNVSLPANSTSSIYLNTQTAAIQVAGSFPITNCYPLAVAVTGTGVVNSLIDSRPDIGGVGGGGTSLTGTGIARNTGACTELSGDVTTSGSNATTLANVGTAGTYTKVTTNAQGRVSSGTTLGYPDLPTTSGGTVSLIEDFISAPGNTVTVNGINGARWDCGLQYAPLTGGTTGTIVSNDSSQISYTNPGDIVLTTPAVSGNGIAITSTTSPTGSGMAQIGALGLNAPWQADFWFKLPATITNICVRAGIVITSANTEPPTNGMWVEYDTANVNSNGAWTLRTVASSSSTYVSTTVVPVGSTFYHVLVSSSVAGTISAQVSASNGALSSAVTSNTNVTSTTGCGIGMQLVPRTTAAVTLTVDRMSYSATIGRA